MASEPSTAPSFSAGRNWAHRLNVAAAILVVLTLGGMLNYLAARHYARMPLSDQRRTQLSPQTLRVLRSLTNEVRGTIFFDARGQEELHGLTTALLREYNYANPKVVFKTVDPVRQPAKAELFLARYKLTGLKDKNFIHLDCGGRTKVIYESELSDYDLNAVLSGHDKEFHRIAFKGEMLFTTALFNLANPRQYKICFLQGHGEHDPDKTETPHGYGKFAAILAERSNARWEKLTLLGTNDIPADCQLLVIAGPRLPFETVELEKISRFLHQGGRLFALIGNLAYTGSRQTGLEKLLAESGIGVAANMVFDPKNSPTGNDLLTAGMNRAHPIMKALMSDDADLRLRLVLPRAVGKSTTTTNAGPDAPQVTVLATTSEAGTSASEIRDGVPYRNPYTDRTGVFPLMAAAEQGSVKGITTERGAMRLVVVGDSLGLDNELIDTAPANHYFAALAVDWLLDRPEVLLQGLLPRPLKEYRIIMTAGQQKVVAAILLAGLPGIVLLLGGLVWWRRRS